MKNCAIGLSYVQWGLIEISFDAWSQSRVGDFLFSLIGFFFFNTSILDCIEAKLQDPIIRIQLGSRRRNPYNGIT